MRRILLTLCVLTMAVACHAQDYSRGILLKWGANTEDDLSHYNAYLKAEEDFEQINPAPIRETHFETEVTTAGLHVWGVTAVDFAGNESEMATTSGTITLQDLDKDAPAMPVYFHWLFSDEEDKE